MRVVLLTTVALSICATSASGQSLSPEARIGSEYQACLRQAREFPGMNLIRNHVPDWPAQPTFDQLTDESLVSADEASALREFHAAVEKCRQQELTELISELPGLASILSTAYAHSDDYVIELLQKKITWGEYARRWRSLDNEVRAQIAAEEQRMASGAQRAQEADIARQQAAAADYLQRRVQIPPLAPLPPPKPITVPSVTTCGLAGNTAQCMTQ